MKSMHELSIITVNYNGLNDTEKLIDSLQTYIPGAFELIVVDNGSVQNEAIVLQQKYPFIKAIRSEKNRGFAGGNNLGIREATGAYFLFINNDTYLIDDSILKLVDRFKERPDLGGISPKIMFADEKLGIQFSGYTPLSKITLINRSIGYMEQDFGYYNSPYATPYLHGAAMMISRVAIEKAGIMPEIYFLYYEELDWSLQLRRSGYELEYNPVAIVYHSESRSTGVNSPLKVYYMTRNRLLFACRNLQGIYRWLSIIYQFVIPIPGNTIKGLLKRRFDLVKAIAKGVIDFFKIKDKKSRQRYTSPDSGKSNIS